jgi:hypothetical protein
MNDMIFETVVTTLGPDGAPHLAPMGVRYQNDDVILMPFKPSATYDNIIRTRYAVLNLTTDVRVFAGCVTGHRDWPMHATTSIPGMHLQAALSHVEMQLMEESADELRPRLRMKRVHAVHHGEFIGFNRAQAAVIEGAVLVSRLHMLPPEKIDQEMTYLQIAIDKTAGPLEHEAWSWLKTAVEQHRIATSADAHLATQEDAS